MPRARDDRRLRDCAGGSPGTLPGSTGRGGHAGMAGGALWDFSTAPLAARDPFAGHERACPAADPAWGNLTDVMRRQEPSGSGVLHGLRSNRLAEMHVTALALTVTFTRPTGASDVSYEAEASADLVVWETRPGGSERHRQRRRSHRAPWTTSHSTEIGRFTTEKD